MGRDAPWWARALLAADRAAHAALRAETALRDELLCALLDDAQRAALTASIYAAEGTYRAGSRMDREGLRPWEREALGDPVFPREGAVLVAGCGGGRELAALRARGYEVVGFDPCDALVRDCAARFAGDPAARCVKARIEDLPLASEGLGPLAFVRDARVDAAVFGWTSLSYVPSRAGRVAALGAVRALAPRAPVLLSAWGPRAAQGARVRAALRRALSATGHRAPEGMTFRPWAGFVVELTSRELADAARDAGYAVARAGEAEGPWALLRPDFI